MTDANDTLDRDTLYVTDAEMIRRMGVPEKIAQNKLVNAGSWNLNAPSVTDPANRRTSPQAAATPFWRT